MSKGFRWPCTRTRGGLLVAMCRSLPPISIIFFSSSLSVIPAHPSDVRSLQNRFAQDFFECRQAERRS